MSAALQRGVDSPATVAVASLGPSAVAFRAVARYDRVELQVVASYGPHLTRAERTRVVEAVEARASRELGGPVRAYGWLPAMDDVDSDDQVDAQTYAAWTRR